MSLKRRKRRPPYRYDGHGLTIHDVAKLINPQG